jgi:hypothetical protein
VKVFRSTPLSPDCANLACSNKQGEGAFAITETEANVVGGHRPIRLLLCAPCSEALKQVTA